MNLDEETTALNNANMNNETLEAVSGGGKKKEPVGPIPKYSEGQWFRKYWPTSMNWSYIEIVKVTSEYDPPRGFKYIVVPFDSIYPYEREEWLEASGSPWQPVDRPRPGSV